MPTPVAARLIIAKIRGHAMSEAFITNMPFPKSLDEVLYYMDKRGKFDVEEVLEADYVEWTAPKDAFIGETVYFMHSKTSIDTIRHLKRELALAQGEIDQETFEILNSALCKGEELYAELGGSVFALGKVCDEIIVDDVATRDGLHWRSKYYAPIDAISLIKPPINIAEFRSFITVSRIGAVTKLSSEQNERLQALIK